MVLCSDEYCRKCDRMQVVYEETFCGGSHYRCLECNTILDTVFDDDEYYCDGTD